MAVAPFQIIAGPADVWIAPVATAFPAVNAAPVGAWVALGRTEGGVTVRHTQSVEMLMSDQDNAAIKAIRSEEGLEVEFSMAELTLENYRYAVNNATITAEAGPPAIKRIDLYRGIDVQQHALLVRGPSPYMNAQLQYQIPVVVQTEEPEVEFVRDDKAILNVVFAALVDFSGGPKFGRLIAQTA